jgi:hypothetical protein
MSSFDDLVAAQVPHRDVARLTGVSRSAAEPAQLPPRIKDLPAQPGSADSYGENQDCPFGSVRCFSLPVGGLEEGETAVDGHYGAGHEAGGVAG